MEYSRHDDPTPIKCFDCKWLGTVKDCIHTYRGFIESDDVAPVDLCPKCRSENLIPIKEELVPA